MLGKISKRINQIIQTQGQATPTNNNRVIQSRNFNTTPPKTRNSQRFYNSDNGFVNYSTIEAKRKATQDLDQIENPLNKSPSSESQRKLLKQFGTILQSYKSEIIDMIHPLIIQMENRIVTRLVQVQKQIKQINKNNNVPLHPDIFQPQFTLSSNFKPQAISYNFQQSMMNLASKAEAIQEVLLSNTKSIFLRLDNLQIKVGCNRTWSQSSKTANCPSTPTNKCNCQQFLQKVMITQSSLTQQIKFIKHQVQKLRDFR